ncbi:multiple sugar transport system substrate-binding protein [Lentzea atacamensis]|uniref:Multiple sugar transport system substrate-binding protein n=1 Tax=Lentzea atacamensis TaxID=531938 RepID=A0A316HSZ7_9PSEU|nr:extracellular solute-binding protein [Lentzea atacamensis]PWK83683.1 multiple sugar transport system substrate-binding protein [Lentzea atacamensis]RAS70352.1 multiple sugar transport system substrate-binding protein [Lentzea atacamensis]
MTRWLVALLLVAGCGGLGPSVADQPNTLTTMGFGLPDEHATARVKVFRDRRPEVDLRVNEGALDEQQFLSAVAADDPPDLVYADRRKLGGYAARGAVQDLGPCLRRHQVDLKVFREAAVRQVTYAGTVYGVPDFFSVRVLILNNPVLREAGVDPATLSTTDWQRLAETTAKLARTEDGRLRRIGFDPRVPEFVALWAKANGADLIGDEPHLDDPRVVEAVRYTTGLVRAQGGWAAFKAFRDTFDSFGANNEFVTGQVAAMAMDSWYVNTIAANSPDADVTVAPFTDRQGNPLTEAGGQAWAIPQGARHPELACEFIATMTAADTWVTAAKARRDALAEKGKPYSGTFTGNRAADEKIFSEVYDPRGIRVLEQGVRVLQSVQDKAFALPPNPAASDLVRSWESAVTRVLLGQQSPEESMAQARREADRAITRVGGR